jgi:uncharacterized membrane protein YesL
MMGPFVTLACTRIWQLCAINLVGLALVSLGGIVFGLAPGAGGNPVGRGAA